jgi:peptidoglycan/xylan/chitin deacetylase (PgdA/CDA1 family)
MNPYLVKTPKLVQRMYPKRVWSLPAELNSLFLTFDDGPIPEVTPWVLDTLANFDAKATFFCIGENVRKHPDLFKRIISEGHSVGNHTFNHLKGWKTSTEAYIENVSVAEDEMRLNNYDPSGNRGYPLFRPPYGKLKRNQANILQKKGYKIVMWDVLSFDWDGTVSKEKCFSNVSKHIESGSIVVFHDSLKAEKNLRYALPKVLELAVAHNYKLKAL